MNSMDTQDPSATNGIASAVGGATDRASELLRDSSQQLREQAAKASEMAVAYAKDEPIKALLIAAAAGALLMGMLSMLAGSSD